MILMILGMVLWAVAHGLKIHAPARRAAMVGAYGEGPVKIGATVLVLVSVGLMIYGYQTAPFIPVWTPPGWTVHLNNLLMFVALGVYVAGAIPSHVRHWIRHPQLTAVKIWAVAHLLVNGDLASIILFGGLLAWAVAALIGLNKRDGKGPKPAAGPMWWDGVHILVTVLLLIGVGMIHAYLGIWPFPG